MCIYELKRYYGWPRYGCNEQYNYCTDILCMFSPFKEDFP